MPLLAQALLRELKMRIAGRRDDHQLNAHVRQQFLHRPRNLHARMDPGRLIAAALHHAGQLQTWSRRDDGGVEKPSRQAKSNHTHANWFPHNEH